MHPAPTPPDGPDPARYQALGRVAGELVHDLANVVAALDARARLAAGEGRLGRLPLAELDRVAETTGEMAAMLRDVLDVMRGAALSPEVTMDPVEVARRAVQRILPALRPLDVRVTATVPSALRVRGRASFLSRALTNLLANASRHARGEVRVTVGAERRGGRPFAVLAVEDDGPGFGGPHPRRRAGDASRPDHALAGTGMGLSAVAWAVEQLGGTVARGAGTELGGARVEIRLPAVLEGEERATGRARVLVLEDGGEMAAELWAFLHARNAELVEADEPPESEEEFLYAILRARPDVLLLDPEAGGGRGVRLWETLNRLAPTLAERALFLTLLPGDHVLVGAARRTGRPVLLLPIDFSALGEALDALDPPRRVEGNEAYGRGSDGDDPAPHPAPPGDVGPQRRADDPRSEPESDKT